MSKIAVGLFIGVLSVFIMACETPAEDCLRDLDCLSERTKWRLSAEKVCVPGIEARAQYNARWTEGFLGTKFDMVGLMPPDYDTVRYSGSEVEFQNGFGVWQQHGYSCVYDPVNDWALEVNVW